MAAAAKMRIFIMRANSSMTKAPLKVVPAGARIVRISATMNRPMDRPVMRLVVSSLRKAPSISMAMAPTARTISGRAGIKSGTAG